MKVELLDDVQVPGPTEVRGTNVVKSAGAKITVPEDVGKRFVRIGVAVEIKGK